jgi:hypothetical protein
MVDPPVAIGAAGRQLRSRSATVRGLSDPQHDRMNRSPYAPPQSAVIDPSMLEGSEAERTRREHIRHEIQLKAVGALYYFGGVMLILGGIGMVAVLVSDSGTAGKTGALFGLVAAYLLIGGLSLLLGYGFRRVKPWVRIPGGILSGIGLLGIPIGTLVNGWILYLMFSKKGQVVLSPEYQAVIVATPHVKYVRTMGEWIALGVVVALLLGVVALLVIGATGR